MYGHRHNQSVPSASHICARKLHDRRMRKHRGALRGVRSTIDNKAPPPMPHLQERAAFHQRRFFENARIERDNLLLVDKMRSILARKQVDNVQKQIPRSLNRTRRKMELTRLVLENERILTRIIKKPSSYSVRKWDKEHKKKVKLLNNICRHGYKDPTDPRHRQSVRFPVPAAAAAAASGRHSEDMIPMPPPPSSSRPGTGAYRRRRSRPTSRASSSAAPMSADAFRQTRRRRRRRQSRRGSSSRGGGDASVDMAAALSQADGNSSTGTSEEMLRSLFSGRQKPSRRIFDNQITISGNRTHVRVYERVDPWRLDIKAFEPVSQLEYMLSLPFEQLHECFGSQPELFQPENRELLVAALASCLLFVPSEYDDTLELCVDLEPQPGTFDDNGADEGEPDEQVFIVKEDPDAAEPEAEREAERRRREQEEEEGDKKKEEEEQRPKDIVKEPVEEANALPVSVKVSLEASGLPKTDILSKTDPLVVVYQQDATSGAWYEVGRTEVVKDRQDDVKWTRDVFIKLPHADADASVMFGVFDAEDDQGDKKTPIGSAVVQTRVIRDVGGSLGVPLRKDNAGDALNDGKAVLLISLGPAQEASAASAATEEPSPEVTAVSEPFDAKEDTHKVPAKMQVSLEASGLPKTDSFSKTDPLVVVYQQDAASGAWYEVGRTEVVKDRQDDVKWTRDVSIKLDSVDADASVMFGVFDAEDDQGDKKTPIGSAVVQTRVIRDVGGSLGVPLRKDNAGDALNNGKAVLLIRLGPAIPISESEELKEEEEDEVGEL